MTNLPYKILLYKGDWQFAQKLKRCDTPSSIALLLIAPSSTFCILKKINYDEW